MVGMLRPRCISENLTLPELAKPAEPVGFAGKGCNVARVDGGGHSRSSLPEHAEEVLRWISWPNGARSGRHVLSNIIDVCIVRRIVKSHVFFKAGLFGI